MRILISFGSLLLSVALLQLSAGGLGPLDVLSGIALGFSTAEIGLLGSAHFVGFFIGCFLAPRLLGSIGHSRTFAAFTALGAISLLAHMMFPDPMFWAFLRVGTGVFIAGCYTVVEAWLHAKVTNANRGRSMSVYRSVDMGASLSAQLLIGVLEPAVYFSYNMLTLLCCAALLPLTLTRASPPTTPRAPRLRPLLAFQRSPLAALAVIIAGLSNAAMRMAGPIYGNEIGLDAREIGFFLAAFVAGGAIAQYPTGWLADKWNRRHVLVILSVLSVLSASLLMTTAGLGVMMAMVTSAILGFVTGPIYSVGAAHAHDFATDDERVELSAALMFLYATGAITSPLTASVLIDTFGPAALFWLISVGHLALLGYTLARMRVRDTRAERVPYTYVPRTSFIIGRLLDRRRGQADDENDGKS